MQIIYENKRYKKWILFAYGLSCLECMMKRLSFVLPHYMIVRSGTEKAISAPPSQIDRSILAIKELMG